MKDKHDDKTVDWVGNEMKPVQTERGIIVFEEATLGTPFNPEQFQIVDMGQYLELENFQWALHTNIGSLTVLDRMTGFGGGIRDIETGFRDTDGNFWLASGNVDVRESGCNTLGEAIEWVKKRANTCAPKEDV